MIWILGTLVIFSRHRKDGALECLFQTQRFFTSALPWRIAEFHICVFFFGCLLGLAIPFSLAGCWKCHPLHEAFLPPHSQHQTCSLWHTLRTCPSSSETFASSNHDFAFLSYSVALISASLRCLAQCLAQRNQKIRIDFLNCDLNSRTWSFKIMRERFPTYRSLLIYKENGLLYCCSYPE